MVQWRKRTKKNSLNHHLGAIATHTPLCSLFLDGAVKAALSKNFCFQSKDYENPDNIVEESAKKFVDLSYGFGTVYRETIRNGLDRWPVYDFNQG